MTILRYPGGKSRGRILREICEILTPRLRGVYGEPFFGGGGVGLHLMKSGLVRRIAIAEKDSALLDLWKSIIREPDVLARRVRAFRPSVDAFLASKQRCLEGHGDALDALVVNRCSHGGRGVMAGPQGGVNQDRKYLIDCRWNPATLERRISGLSALLRPRIVSIHSDYRDVQADCYYFDPPYWGVGDGLYQHSFTPEDHELLAADIDCLSAPFVLSYNPADQVRERYAAYPSRITGTAGNGGGKPGSEILIWSP
jgi:DNA adenine methylase